MKKQDICDESVNVADKLKYDCFKTKLWNLFENTIGAGILKTLEGALHVVESADRAWDRFEHKVRLLEIGMTEEEYEKFCRECDAETKNATKSNVPANSEDAAVDAECRKVAHV